MTVGDAATSNTEGYVAAAPPAGLVTIEDSTVTWGGARGGQAVRLVARDATSGTAQVLVNNTVFTLSQGTALASGTGTVAVLSGALGYLRVLDSVFSVTTLADTTAYGVNNFNAGVQAADFSNVTMTIQGGAKVRGVEYAGFSKWLKIRASSLTVVSTATTPDMALIAGSSFSDLGTDLTEVPSTGGVLLESTTAAVGTSSTGGTGTRHGLAFTNVAGAIIVNGTGSLQLLGTTGATSGTAEGIYVRETVTGSIQWTVAGMLQSLHVGAVDGGDVSMEHGSTQWVDIGSKFIDGDTATINIDHNTVTTHSVWIGGKDGNGVARDFGSIIVANNTMQGSANYAQVAVGTVQKGGVLALDGNQFLTVSVSHTTAPIYCGKPIARVCTFSVSRNKIVQALPPTTDYAMRFVSVTDVNYWLFEANDLTVTVASVGTGQYHMAVSVASSQCIKELWLRNNRITMDSIQSQNTLRFDNVNNVGLMVWEGNSIDMTDSSTTYGGTGIAIFGQANNMVWARNQISVSSQYATNIAWIQSMARDRLEITDNHLTLTPRSSNTNFFWNFGQPSANTVSDVTLAMRGNTFHSAAPSFVNGVVRFPTTFNNGQVLWSNNKVPTSTNIVLSERSVAGTGGSFSLDCNTGVGGAAYTSIGSTYPVSPTVSSTCLCTNSLMCAGGTVTTGSPSAGSSTGECVCTCANTTFGATSTDPNALLQCRAGMPSSRATCATEHSCESPRTRLASSWAAPLTVPSGVTTGFRQLLLSPSGNGFYAASDQDHKVYKVTVAQNAAIFNFDSIGFTEVGSGLQSPLSLAGWPGPWLEHDMAAEGKDGPLKHSDGWNMRGDFRALFVGSHYQACLQILDPQTGTKSTIVGLCGTNGTSTNGTGAAVRLATTVGGMKWGADATSTSTSPRSLFFGDLNNQCIKRIDFPASYFNTSSSTYPNLFPTDGSSLQVTTVVGVPQSGTCPTRTGCDGWAHSASTLLNYPTDVALSADGEWLWFVESHGARLRKAGPLSSYTGNMVTTLNDITTNVFKQSTSAWFMQMVHESTGVSGISAKNVLYISLLPSTGLWVPGGVSGTPTPGVLVVETETGQYKVQAQGTGTANNAYGIALLQNGTIVTLSQTNMNAYASHVGNVIAPAPGLSMADTMAGPDIDSATAMVTNFDGAYKVEYSTSTVTPISATPKPHHGTAARWPGPEL